MNIKCWKCYAQANVRKTHKSAVIVFILFRNLRGRKILQIMYPAGFNCCLLKFMQNSIIVHLSFVEMNKLEVGVCEKVGFLCPQSRERLGSTVSDTCLYIKQNYLFSKKLHVIHCSKVVDTVIKKTGPVLGGFPPSLDFGAPNMHYIVFNTQYLYLKRCRFILTNVYKSMFLQRQHNV